MKDLVECLRLKALFSGCGASRHIDAAAILGR
jgi:hypothetical protein